MLFNKKAYLFAGLVCCLALPVSADEHRQLGAHVHGHGRLNIAVEDNTVSIEFEAPGADITGFEHEAATPEQKAALNKARAKLAEGLTLFTPSAAAGCVQKNAKVAVEAGHHAEAEKAGAAEEEGQDHHSEFHAEYVFECASPARLSSLAFGYFKAFPNAQELDVSVISPKGQSSYEVKRDKPSLDLTGMM